MTEPAEAGATSGRRHSVTGIDGDGNRWTVESADWATVEELAQNFREDGYTQIEVAASSD